MQSPIRLSPARRVESVHIRRSDSRQLKWLFITINFFACGVVTLLTVFYSSWFVVVMPGLFLYMRWSYRCHVKRTWHSSVIEAWRTTSNNWELRLQCGQVEQVILLGDSILLPGIMILRFRRPGNWRTRTVVLMPDTLGANNYRRLCVKLLTSKVVPTAG